MRPIEAFVVLAATLLSMALFSAGCSGSASTSAAGESGSWSAANDFIDQLQNIDLNALGETAFDIVIIDPTRDGSDATRFTAGQISQLKDSAGGAKRVLAYVSIGEAEDYRWYWDSAWDADGDGVPDGGAPAWLGPQNPDWPGNYKVRYWDPAWQSILFGSAASALDKIIDAGFDGAFLDVVDAYQYWGPGGESGLERALAEQEMVDLVKAIAAYARTTKGRTDFGVFPLNGEELSSHPDYIEAVTGIGKEDAWYAGNVAESSAYTDAVIANLDVFARAGKLVLVIDYVTQPALIDDFYSKARARGYLPYATVRDLDALTINPGHEPD